MALAVFGALLGGCVAETCEEDLVCSLAAGVFVGIVEEIEGDDEEYFEPAPPIYARDALVEIDLATGDRRRIADAFAPGAAAADRDARRVYVWEADRRRITGIDTLTGARNTVAANGMGGGPALQSVRAMILDGSRNALVVLDDRHPGALLRIDLLDGSRSFLTDTYGAAGPILEAPFALAFDPIDDRIVVADGSDLVVVDASSGERSLLDGVGPPLGTIAALAYDDLDDRLLVLDGLGALLAVDPGSGDRTPLSPATYKTPRAMVATPFEILFVHAGDVTDSLFALGRDGGRRVVLSGLYLGLGPLLPRPIGLFYDALRDRALVVTTDF